MGRPRLGGGITSQQWLRSVAKDDRKKQANYRAQEAEAIASYIDELERQVANG